MAVEFSKENQTKTYVQQVLRDSFTEEEAHTAAKEMAVIAEKQWEAYTNSEEVTLSSYESTVKPIVLEAAPYYDASVESIEKTVTETETQIVHGWTKVSFSSESLGMRIRSKRAEYLKQTDHYALNDRTMPEEIKVYRQALRDITDQETFPQSVVWPVRPVD